MAASLPHLSYGARSGNVQKYDILLHIDEVVCGVGRTGTWFGYQNYGIKPDLVTMAKGVASGYAAIACLVTTEVFDMFKDDASDPMNYFRDISTFGGCTLALLRRLKICGLSKTKACWTIPCHGGAWLKTKCSG